MIDKPAPKIMQRGLAMLIDLSLLAILYVILIKQYCTINDRGELTLTGYPLLVIMLAWLL